MDALIADGYASPTVPDKKGTPIRSLKPFRAESSPSSLSSPDAGDHRRPLVPPPTGGDRDGDVAGGTVDPDEQLLVALPGSDDYLPNLFAAFENGHVTEGEWHQGDHAHRLVNRRRRQR